MKLEPMLEERGIDFEVHTHRATYTSQGLAHVEHVSGYNVAKPVIVKSTSGFTMCVVPAPSHVDLSRVADVLHEADVRLATEEEMCELFPDCDLGAEPPMGYLFGMQTIVDEQLSADDFLVMQAGSHTESVTLRRDDWARLCEPVVAPIAGS